MVIGTRMEDVQKESVWASRRKWLPRLHSRAQNIVTMIFGGLEVDEDGNLVFPGNLTRWLRRILSDAGRNGLEDQLDLFNVDMQKYTQHKYISIQEYEEFNEFFVRELSFPEEKFYNILYLANLSLLLIQILELTSEWSMKSPEERALAITNIELLFPNHFLPAEKDISGVEAGVLMELRTQIFVQLFLENLHTSDEEWNSKHRVNDIFKLSTIQKQRKNSKDLTPDEKYQFTYSRFALIRAKNLEEETVGTDDPEKVEQDLLGKYPWEKALREIIPWIQSNVSYLENYFAENKSAEDYKGTKVVPIPFPEPVSEAEVPPINNRFNDQVESELDSSSSEEDDNIDPVQAARILAKNRGPRKAEEWAKAQFSPKQPQTPTGKSVPLFIPSASESEQEDQEEPESSYQIMLRMTGQAPGIQGGSQRRNSALREFSATASEEGPTLQERRKSQILERRKSLGVGQKKSIFDEQSDARKISFDSQRNTPRNTPPAQPTRKRPRTPSSDSDSSDEFQEYNPPPDADRREKSRISALAHRPPPPSTDRTESILDRIHGPESPRDTIHGSGGARKGRGFEWTERQEKFLITQIEIYGPAWADIARVYCKPGQILEGRDQTKLKDKARNIKEKCIREGRRLPKNFEGVTPIGKFEEAKKRMEATRGL